jgi:hypothetical protein
VTGRVRQRLALFRPHAAGVLVAGPWLVADWTGLRLASVPACAARRRGSMCCNHGTPCSAWGGANSAAPRRAGAGAPQAAQARDWRGGLCAEQAIDLLRDFYAAGNPKGARTPAQPPATKLWSAAPGLSRLVLCLALEPNEWALAYRSTSPACANEVLI